MSTQNCRCTVRKLPSAPRTDSELLDVLLGQIALTSNFASDRARALSLVQLANTAERIRREREARA